VHLEGKTQKPLASNFNLKVLKELSNGNWKAVLNYLTFHQPVLDTWTELHVIHLHHVSVHTVAHRPCEYTFLAKSILAFCCSFRS
jgi:hypothetical protein